MDAKLFSLFYVSEYKGGELHRSPNLSEEQLCEELYGDNLWEYFWDAQKEKILKTAYESDEILDIYDKTASEYWDNIYAYDAVGCYTCYQHIDNRLVKVDIPGCLTDVVKIEYFNKILKDFLNRYGK